MSKGLRHRIVGLMIRLTEIESYLVWQGSLVGGGLLRLRGALYLAGFVCRRPDPSGDSAQVIDLACPLHQYRRFSLGGGDAGRVGILCRRLVSVGFSDSVGCGRDRLCRWDLAAVGHSLCPLDAHDPPLSPLKVGALFHHRDRASGAVRGEWVDWSWVIARVSNGELSH